MVDHVAGTGVLLRRFLEGGDERLPWLPETQTNISVYIVGMKLNLSGLPNNVIYVSGFSGEDGEASYSVVFHILQEWTF
jgi:hypothetical protein